MVELWGGIECTHNRVGDVYFDQLNRNGHATRLEDLDLIAGLGIRALRYPVLWERVAPNGLDRAEWGWVDERLNRLRELGVRPIVGLVHHGSGPRHTSLIDPAFPTGLAEFAAAVAERYPWVDAWTPVNEPLTTARFSGLYGLWYPHGRDNATFLKTLWIQCRAVVLSMRAIRQVNPKAQLIQTDDIGKTASTPLLSYQAELENERHWLGYDLLCGRVDSQHSLWEYLLLSGMTEAELAVFQEDPCPPDIIGLNHYVTSDRYLDEHLENYPEWSHGGNGIHQYADVHALGFCPENATGLRVLMREAWERYGLPVAVTEAHLGGAREAQMRWLQGIWDTAHDLSREGVDVRAVTVWSLLGAFDWNVLVTRDHGFYESGVYDLRSQSPRPTALAGMVQSLGKGERHDHPAMTSLRPLAITGARGTLGQAFARLCEERGLRYHLLTRQEMDIADPVSVEHALDELKPWAVINAAGYVRVDDAEGEPDRCHRENALGPMILAASCSRRRIPLLTFSSDLVFDGAAQAPYRESAAVSPLGVYGRSKVEAEIGVLAAHPEALVVRTSAFFGPWDDYNFLTLALRALAAGQPFRAVSDAVVSPTYVPDLVHTGLDLLVDGERGLRHLANPGAISWADLARLAANEAGLDPAQVQEVSLTDLGLTALRPRYSALGSDHGVFMPVMEDAVGRFVRERVRNR